MKTHYDFPYHFVDFTKAGINFSEAKFDSDHLIIKINLGDYIFDDKIDVALEVENTQTFYRKMFILTEVESVIEIKKDNIGLKANYALYLIARKEGEIEIAEKLDFYEYGDCIAVLEKNSMSCEKDQGIMGLIKIAPTEKDVIFYDLTSDWITIEMPSKSYEKFYLWQKDEKTTPFALASLGNGCIQFAIFQALHHSRFREYKWWEIITQLLNSVGVDSDEIEEDEIPGVTNIILGNSFQEMINQAVPEIDFEDTTILA